MTTQPFYTAFLGVDPGLQGGLALYFPEALGLSEVWPMPINPDGVDGEALTRLVKAVIQPCNPLGAVELVHGRPRQAGVFNFGLGTGIVHGILHAHGIPFRTVTPSLWKPAMGLIRRQDETQEDTKDRARALATKLFPHLEKQFIRKKDDGKAEALLLAFYIAQQHLKGRK